MSQFGRIYVYKTLHEKGIPYTSNHVRRLIDRELFPRPDFYMSERVPAWTDLTLDVWVEKLQAAHARGENAEKQSERRKAARAAAVRRQELRREAQKDEGEALKQGGAS